MKQASLLMWLQLAVLAAATFAILTSPSFAQSVRVIDGDTINLLDQTYRLHGIDAPELNQSCNTVDGEQWPCGKAAKAKLIALINNEPIICFGSKKDRYQRVIAVCYRGAINLNAEMVRTGYAWAYRKYALDFIAEEHDAQINRRGIWIAPTNTAQEHRQK